MQHHTPNHREVIEELSHRKQEPDWLLQKRLEALAVFEKTALPPFRYGSGIGLDTTALDSAQVDPLTALENPPLQTNTVSDNGVIVTDLHSALETHSDILKPLFLNATPPCNKLSALHAMFWIQGLFIYAPRGIRTEQPLHITMNMSVPSQFVHTVIVAESMSSLSLTQMLTSSTETASAFRSEAVELVANEGARVTYGSIQNLGRNVFNFSTKQAYAERNADISWIDCSLGSGLSRADTTTFLNGQGARTRHWGMFFGNHSQQFDLTATAIHRAAQTTSDMLTKGVLNYKAKAIYRGLIKIHHTAAESNGYQKADTLLLSDQAETDLIPRLEIDNNNVRCSHGASIGRVSEEKLFYLMSRGLSPHHATKLFVEGFFEPMIQRMEMKEIRSTMRNLIAQKMNAQSSATPETCKE
jgi:Fe-S cluster assembly protein SufD